MEPEERGLVGLEARTVDGEEVGRISEVVVDESTGEVTHVLVDIDEDRWMEMSMGAERRMEIPITDLSLDPEADFATFHADPSDEEPGDHVGDEEMPLGYAPSRDISPEDRPHEGQFVAAPEDPSEAQSPEELAREMDDAGGWEDEGSTTFDSGYPRNDAYIDPDTGQELERYPAEGEDLRGDVEQLLDGTELKLREVREGVIVLEGSMTSQDVLQEVLADIDDIDGVLDVDTTDVNVGT